jgi:phosphoribosylglycinamide formyltransferase-1
MRVGVLVSGRGSNLRALLDALAAKSSAAHVVCVVTNRPGCTALDHARRADVPVHIFAKKEYGSRAARDAAMAETLNRAGVDLVVLAGYDEILDPALLSPFAGRMINVHPSLLPAFAGTLHAQAAALKYGVKVSGCTVHYVTEDVDCGPIIAQAAVPVLDDDDVESLSARILEQEHRLLPQVVMLIAEGKVQLEGRRVHIDEGL